MRWPITRRYYRSGESEYLHQQSGGAPAGHPRAVYGYRPGPGRLFYDRAGQDRQHCGAHSRGHGGKFLKRPPGFPASATGKRKPSAGLDQAEENLLRLRDILSELEEPGGPPEGTGRKGPAVSWNTAAEKRTLEIGLWLEHPRALRPCPAGARRSSIARGPRTTTTRRNRPAGRRLDS